MNADDRVLDLVHAINSCVSTLERGLDLMSQTGKLGGMLRGADIQGTLATVAGAMSYLASELKEAMKEE